MRYPIQTLIIVFLSGFIISLFLYPWSDTYIGSKGSYLEKVMLQEMFVTGYNTVPEQTDETPCIPASGKNICGRDDVAACPRSIPLGTEIIIHGKKYICEDRLALKYDDRIDISCDKDMECPYKITGKTVVKIIHEKNTTNN